MRGEKASPLQKIRRCWGSPPHARGKVDCMRSCLFQQGITPACAGKRPDAIGRRVHLWDHPRMRGEKNLQNPIKSRQTGSPPHARGKEVVLDEMGNPSGITPACAGKRMSVRTGVTCIRDHPRMRGEKKKYGFMHSYPLGSPPHARGKGKNSSKSKSRQPGSPPHARGKARLALPAMWDIGITPACAGKSSGCAALCSSLRDHPRMRGEKYL